MSTIMSPLSFMADGPIADCLDRIADHFERYPQSWTKGAYARDESGGKCLLSNPTACSFCAAGALIRTNGYLGGAAESHLVAVLPRPWDTLVGWNDHEDTQVQDVIALFRRAAAHAREGRS